MRGALAFLFPVISISDIRAGSTSRAPGPLAIAVFQQAHIDRPAALPVKHDQENDEPLRLEVVSAQSRPNN